MPSDIRVQLINDMADIEYVPISCSFLFAISVLNYKVDVELNHCFTSISDVTMHVSVHDTINQFTDVYI